MNATVVFGSLAALGLMAFVIWIYRRGRSEGATEQKDKDRRANSDYMAKHADDFYSGNVGTNALRVRNPWVRRENTIPDIRPRLESRKNGSHKREKDGDKVHDA